MIPIIVGSFLLSIVHALVPNHWIPLVAIGRTERWSKAETLTATAFAGIAHTLSTIIFGIVVGFLGYTISSKYDLFTSIVAPVVLVLLGFLYLILDWRGSHHHTQSHIDEQKISSKRTKFAIIASLSFAMFFSPCIEIEAYYFYAGQQGWVGIAIVSTIYFVITVLGMIALVYLTFQGLEKFKWHFLEHHEKGVTGIILIALGVFAYLAKL